MGVLGDGDGKGGGVGEVDGAVTFDFKVGGGEGSVVWARSKNNIFTMGKLVR